MFGILKDVNLVPIFGMAFVAFLIFLKYQDKQQKRKEKIALIEKGLDTSLLDSKSKNQ